MPIPTDNIISIPKPPRVSVALEPVFNLMYSLLLLAREEETSGLSDWVAQTARSMSKDEMGTHRLVMNGLYHVVMPQRSWQSFPAYLDYLAAADPVALRDRMLAAYIRQWIRMPGGEAQKSAADAERMKAHLLSSEQAYIDFLQETAGIHWVDVEIEREAYHYAVDPPAMRALAVGHLRQMWESFLAPEWVRVRPLLQESVEAFRKIDFGGMSNLEAAQLVTGRPLDDWHGRHDLDTLERLVLIPNAHIGPAVGKISDEAMTAILFQAHVPEGAADQAPNLSRTEIIVRLGALADDSRMRILRYLAEQGEQRAQDVIQALDMSQSSASRHLSQLSAAGFVDERRVDGSKAYTLNPQRIDAALQAASAYLKPSK